MARGSSGPTKPSKYYRNIPREPPTILKTIRVFSTFGNVIDGGLLRNSRRTINGGPSTVAGRRHSQRDCRLFSLNAVFFRPRSNFLFLIIIIENIQRLFYVYYTNGNDIIKQMHPNS